jgi:hypothetical protein
MKKSIKVLITLLMVVLFASACVATGGNVAQPTPNLTLTALFNPNVNIPATVTPIYVVVTNTPEPTAMPTNTSQPTNTTQPTNTAIAPTNTVANTAVPPKQGARGYMMYAGKINFAPTIDGSWEDWKDYTTQYPVAYVVYGKSNWSGADDLQASYAMTWDADNLYIGVKVHDDVYTQEATGENIFKGDSIEILLDTNLSGDYYVQSLSSDDYQLGISAGSGGSSPEAWLWYPSGKAGSKTSVDIGFMKEDGLWRIEAAIPWSVLGVTPSKGLHMGIAVSVSDDDNTSSSVQQTMVSSAPYRSLGDPTTWGDLILN